MKKLKTILAVLLLMTLTIPGYAQKPLEDINDILAWKSLRSPVVSNDGKWLAYRLAPAEGDGEVIIKEARGEKEYKFPVGEGPRFASGEVSFSEDSRWIAFNIYPKREEARKLKKQKKKVYNNAGLVNLATGDKIEFEQIKRFSFSGENPSWIVFHRYPPEEQAKEKEKWSGSNLILYELATKKALNIGNVSEFAFDKKGLWLAWTVDAHGQSGNGVQIRNMKTGVILPLDSDKAEYKRLTWTEKGDGLTVLKGKEDDNFEDKLFSVLGFTSFTSSVPEKFLFDPGEDKNFPKNMTISPNRTPIWTEDFSGILFGIHEVKPKKDTKEEPEPEEETGEEEEAEKKAPTKPKAKPEPPIDKEDLPGVVIWHWKDKRMQSMQQVQENRDKNFSYLAVYLVQEKKFIRLADDKLKSVSPAPKHLWAIGYDNREYELTGNLEGRRYRDVYVIDMKTGQRRLALKKHRWIVLSSPDGTHFLYYKKGHYHTYEMASGKSYNISKDVPVSFINTEDDHNVVDPPIYPIGWVKDGISVLLYDNWDIWDVPVHGGKGINLTVNGKTDGIRYRTRYRLDRDEKGIDLSQPVYLGPYGEWTKKAGIGRIDKGKPGVKMLLWDDAYFSLTKAKKADVYFYTKQTYKDYPDYYVTDSSMKNGKKITEANPQQKDFLWSSGSKLLDYQSAKGDRLQAALFLPANYEEDKSYPTIVYIYEKLSRGLNRYYSPSASGFNKSVYTSRGYAVLMPDIVYKVNDPGMSSVWCVLPAVEAAVATGVVDKDRIGIHGHSWGGYQSSFLVTQTDIFKACVTGAPLTNMISMYSSIYWNSGSANQPIFESSQGRFYGGYWDNLEAYARNSPVYFAQNVKTPLIILHNDNDGAVDWNQGIEWFNTLRRLGKPVILLQYKGENHGLRKPPNQKDYTVRMREFFDHHLMGKPAPKWMTDGVPHLDHKEHIEKVTRKILEKKTDKKKEVKKKKKLS
ncbi:MAG: prolyl oligopeptidase family serine peptidase [Candidatus Aminicenantes bacterium]|jgi:dipeptidyl aminopeptidase/acylaminoacyl peptidase